MSTQQRSTNTRTSESMRLCWGLGRPERPAETLNVSREGMFIESPSPLDAGTTLNISLRIAACTLPLRGRVAWTRTEPDEHGPTGMGVALLRPPALYLHYVGQLLAEAG